MKPAHHTVSSATSSVRQRKSAVCMSTRVSSRLEETRLALTCSSQSTDALRTRLRQAVLVQPEGSSTTRRPAVAVPTLVLKSRCRYGIRTTSQSSNVVTLDYFFSQKQLNSNRRQLAVRVKLFRGEWLGGSVGGQRRLQLNTATLSWCHAPEGWRAL